MKLVLNLSIEKAICVFVASLLFPSVVFAQVSPYGLSPDWAFGQGGRLTFTNGNFPTSSAPAIGSRLTNTGTAIENSTSICQRNGAVAIYTNTMQAYNGASSTGWFDFIRNFGPLADNKCAGSSTGGAVAFPDPVNNATNDAFYLVLSNDLTSGGCGSQGFNRYRFTGTGTTVAYNAGPLVLAVGSFVSEAITACTDGTGGYWVIGHAPTTSNTFRVWRYTATGISGPTDYTVGAPVDDASLSQSYLKVSPCQDKIAYNSGSGNLVVHAFDRNTGVVGAELRRVAPGVQGVGLEFSPDGNRVFFSGQGSEVRYFDISSGVINSVAGSASWSMQLGPDGRIYTSGPGEANANIGFISTPNTTPTYTSLTLTGGATKYRGLINLAWLSPQPASIIATDNQCSIPFSLDFKNYFNTAININTSTIRWDFNGDNTFESAFDGQATPTFDYSTLSGSGTYTVRAQFRDSYCGQLWTVQRTVNATCALPVSWLEVGATAHDGVVSIDWSTASEVNSSYFEVQRSADGINFHALGRLNAAGNSNVISSYSFTDANPLAGTAYYRIRQVDLDGSGSGSRIVAVNLVGPELRVFPNPSAGAFELELSGAAQAKLMLTDVSGKVLYSSSVEGEYVNTRFGEELSRGTYILTVITPTNTLHEKLIKE